MLKSTLSSTLDTTCLSPAASRTEMTLEDLVLAMSPIRESNALAQDGPPSQVVVDSAEEMDSFGVAVSMLMFMAVSDRATMPGKSMGVATSHFWTVAEGSVPSRRR